MPFPRAEDKAMRILAFIFLSLGLAGAQAGIDPKLLLIEQKLGGFQDKDYSLAVEKTLAEFENRTGVGLRPGDLRRCGLKLSSEGGAGLATSKPLVRAITAALIRRGFAQQAITLCDTRVDGLRQAGFLPALSTQSQTFEGQPVIAWEMFSATWAKENQLRYENQVLPRPGTQAVPWGDARVSVLPKTLIDEVDFWINLPVLSDSKSLGVHGAMAAASLGNMANAERFMDNPFNASKAPSRSAPSRSSRSATCSRSFRWSATRSSEARASTRAGVVRKRRS